MKTFVNYNVTKNKNLPMDVNTLNENIKQQIYKNAKSSLFGR